MSLERNSRCAFRMVEGPTRASTSPAVLSACSVAALNSGQSKLSSCRLPESFFAGRGNVRVCSFFSRITVTDAELPDDDGTESGLFPATAFFHRAHQHAVAALDPKELSQLRSDIFHHQPAARRRVDDDHRDR